MKYRIYFPLFDHIEAKSNEVRLTHEGLLAHPKVALVNEPEAADYIIFCQNHIVKHCPFHSKFSAIKEKYINKTILLDYSDHTDYIFDARDFRWKLYFKRACVDRTTNRPMRYEGLAVIPTAYCVVDAMVDYPLDHDRSRNIAVSCLFDKVVQEQWPFKNARGRLVKFANFLKTRYRVPMQVGTVSETGSVGRSAINERYKKCLFSSKIILHANPDYWEGDSRTWEALSSGALVFVDRMCQPIQNPLIDGKHVIFYDLTDEGMAILEKKIIYYLSHDEEREAIGQQGRDFVLSHHRSINRVDHILERIAISEMALDEGNQI